MAAYYCGAATATGVGAAQGSSTLAFTSLTLNELVTFAMSSRSHYRMLYSAKTLAAAESRT